MARPQQDYAEPQGGPGVDTNGDGLPDLPWHPDHPEAGLALLLHHADLATLDAIDRMWAGPPPTLDTTQETVPDQSIGQRIFGSFAGLENQPQQQPRTFAEGLVGGIGRGLGSGGSRIAASRAKLESAIAQRQSARDAANLRATDEYNAAKRRGREKLAGAVVDRAMKEPKTPAEPQVETIVGPDGKPQIVTRQNAIGKRPYIREPASPSGATGDDVKQLADAIEQGLQPPDTKGFYRLAGPVKAELQRRKYDFTKANLDWQATGRQLATLNGPQQTRLRQAADTAYHSLDVIDDLSDKLAALAPSFRGTVPVINRASLALLKSLPGEAGSVARQLEAQITDVTSELGNVYMGGNSPTDHALQLAGKNLSGNWSVKQLKDATALARTNLVIRRNSIANSTPLVPGQQPPVSASPAPRRIRYDAQGNVIQ